MGPFLCSCDGAEIWAVLVTCSTFPTAQLASFKALCDTLVYTANDMSKMGQYRTFLAGKYFLSAPPTHSTMCCMALLHVTPAAVWSTVSSALQVLTKSGPAYRWRDYLLRYVAVSAAGV
jgi:hypothetical protein